MLCVLEGGCVLPSPLTLFSVSEKDELLALVPQQQGLSYSRLLAVQSCRSREVLEAQC